MKTGPDIAVIVVNWNRRDWLRQCLASLAAQTLPPAETVVVDNASTDGSPEMVAAEFPSVKVIRNDRNLGFAEANNIGISATVSPMVALINNDAEADPRWLAEMARSMSPGLGLVACRIIRRERRDLLDNVGVGIWPDGMSRGAFHYFRDAEVAQPGSLIPSGCAMLITREAFKEAGGFDASFFAYSEDTDLGLKVRLLGYGCAVADLAYVYHRGGGGTLGAISPEKTYLVERNRIAVWLRYFPARFLASGVLYSIARYGLLAASLIGAKTKAGRSGLAGGAAVNLKALFRAWRDGLRRSRRDLNLRREWGRKRRISAGLMNQWFREYRLDRESLVRVTEP